MFKSILATTVALILGTLFLAGAAQAGCGSKHGYSKQSFSSSYRAKKAKRARLARLARKRAIAKKKAQAKRRVIAQRKAAQVKKARIAAAKTKARKARIAAAKAEKLEAEKLEAEKVAKAEVVEEEKTAEAPTKSNDKPVSVAALSGADIETDNGGQDTTDNDETGSTGEVNCKKFVPAAGLTITVPCTL